MALVLAIGALVWVDRSPSDVANQASLLVLLVGGLGIGLTTRRRLWLPVVLFGFTLAVARACYVLFGVDLHDPSAPATVPAAAGLLVLVVPVAVTAGLGWILRRAISPLARDREPTGDRRGQNPPT